MPTMDLVRVTSYHNSSEILTRTYLILAECDEAEQNVSIILNGTESELKFLTGNPESKVSHLSGDSKACSLFVCCNCR